MKAIITVGLGFGDEGKGATVDYLCRQLNADLVVRYSGGAQAGHNVQLPDGRRHTFAQFGAGTLAGVPTYLGPRMIICPSSLLPEAEHLRKLGVVKPFTMLRAHPDCLVSTVYHSYMNRLRELSRGANRHGSCGLGIGETRSYWLRHGQDAVVAKDLKDPRMLVSKLPLLRDRCLLDLQELSSINGDLAARMHDTMPAEEADLLIRSSEQLTVQSELPESDTIIFEGSQGVLLDEWKGFHPYTTWSTVTAQHALEMAAESGITDVQVLGITRAYTTRHGAGPFPTHRSSMAAKVADEGNATNAWQGSLRCGPLDLVLLRYAASVCKIDGLVVNGLDQLISPTRVCDEYVGQPRLDVPHSLQDQQQLARLLESAIPVLRLSCPEEIIESLEGIAPVLITSNGPTHLDRASHSFSRTSELVCGLSG